MTRAKTEGVAHRDHCKGKNTKLLTDLELHTNSRYVNYLYNRQAINSHPLYKDQISSRVTSWYILFKARSTVEHLSLDGSPQISAKWKMINE